MIYSIKKVYTLISKLCGFIGGVMRNLVLILIVFLAVITFIRAIDDQKNQRAPNVSVQRIEINTNN